MKTLSRFVTKFTKLIVAMLSCFDRVIFKGYLFISNPQSLEGFIDRVLQIRRLVTHADSSLCCTFTSSIPNLI